MTNDALLGFALGLSVGVLFAVINSEFNIVPQHVALLRSKIAVSPVNNDYMHSGQEVVPLQPDNSIPTTRSNAVTHEHSHERHSVADMLHGSERILCWVMTSPKTLPIKGKAINDTWGYRCNILLFMSSAEHKGFPVVALNVPEGRENLWLKTRAAWSHVYEHYRDKADWFIKVDDDSFLVVENLRHLVSSYDTNKAYYFGRHFKTFNGYNSGGAGYVFSKETLRQFNSLLYDQSKCKNQSFAEDVEVGVCLQAAGIHPTDSRDSLQRERFHPFHPGQHVVSGALDSTDWIHKYNNYPVVTGPDCCSDFSITFHYIDPNQMHVLNFLIYHLVPYGVTQVWNETRPL